jgi:hypothetical protein
MPLLPVPEAVLILEQSIGVQAQHTLHEIGVEVVPFLRQGIAQNPQSPVRLGRAQTSPL